MSDRVPLDERLHGRDLEAAIVLSLLNTEARPKEHASQGVYWMCNLSFNSFLQFVEISVFTFPHIYISRSCTGSSCGG